MADCALGPAALQAQQVAPLLPAIYRPSFVFGHAGLANQDDRGNRPTCLARHFTAVWLESRTPRTNREARNR